MDARAEAQYVMSLDEPSRQRSMRLDDEAKQRERIHQMNDRLKENFTRSSNGTLGSGADVHGARLPSSTRIAPARMMSPRSRLSGGSCRVFPRTRRNRSQMAVTSD